jgi:hypothetical protein
MGAAKKKTEKAAAKKRKNGGCKDKRDVRGDVVKAPG